MRPGDAVEVHFHTSWHPGTVLAFADGKASVQYKFHSSELTRDFQLADVRFPNGEGQWALWKTADGKVKVEARYIARDETSVMIRQADGAEMTLPIDTLSLDLRQKVKRTPITGEENKVDGADPVRVGDEVEVSPYSRNWYDGVVTRVLIGEAEVSYNRNGHDKEELFPFAKIRFPNGEGQWRKWSDTSGQFAVIARYLSRTDKQVTLRKQDGSVATVPIDRLSLKLRQWLRSVPITGQETLIDGVSPVRVGDPVEVWDSSSWVPGVVTQTRQNAATVEQISSTGVSKGKREYPLNEVRHPNGEGAWLKWKSLSGSSVVARLITRDETHVVLVKEDGQQIRVPIDQLDTGLQHKLKQVVTRVKRPNQTTFGSPSRTIGMMAGQPDFQACTIVDGESLGPAWDEGGAGFSLPNGDTVSALIPVAGQEHWVVVGTYASDNFRGDSQSQVHWTQPGTQEYIAGPKLDPSEQLVDYSASQNRMLTAYFPEGRRNAKKIGFSTYSLSPGQQFAEPELSWEVSLKGGSSYHPKVPPARLVGTDHVLTIVSGSALLYDLKDQRIVYSVANATSSRIQLHPSEQYFAVDISNAASLLIETLSGRVLARQSGHGPIGFSNDGSDILRLTTVSIQRWSLRNNTDATVMPKRNLNYTGTPHMLDDRFVWVGGTIYDIQKKAAMWRYDISSKTEKRLVGDRLIAAIVTGSDAQRQVAVGVAKVPHAKAVSMMEPVTVDQMLALKPGTPIQIQASGDERITRGISDAVSQNGWVPDGGARISISGSAGRGATETHVYDKSRSNFFPSFRNRPPGPDAETVSVAPWKQRVEIRLGETVLWSQGSGGYVPSRMQLQKGETAQQKVDGYNQPSWSLFKQLKIPAEVFYPSYRSGVGRTSLTTSGFVDRVNDIKTP